jgi:hypothetical protein
VNLVLDPRAGAHQLLAARQPAAQNPGALIRHPHRLELAPSPRGSLSGALGPAAGLCWLLEGTEDGIRSYDPTR